MPDTQPSLPIGQQVSLPGHFNTPVVLESARRFASSMLAIFEPIRRRLEKQQALLDELEHLAPAQRARRVRDQGTDFKLSALRECLLRPEFIEPRMDANERELELQTSSLPGEKPVLQPAADAASRFSKGKTDKP